MAWYEAGVESDTGWRMHGGLFPGSPFPVLGTNGALGLAATVNLPDLADIYRLTTDDAHRGQYFYRRRMAALRDAAIWLGVKMGWFTVPVPRTLRFTVHGPAFETADGWVAVRYAGAGEIRAIEQFYRMGRAHNYEGWREAMAMRAIPSFNFLYADSYRPHRLSLQRHPAAPRSRPRLGRLRGRRHSRNSVGARRLARPRQN